MIVRQDSKAAGVTVPGQWRDGTKEAPIPTKAPKPPRDPETGAFREG